MEAAERTPTTKPPLSVDADAFRSLPEDWMREARARTAFLVMRGVAPAIAFEKATLGMARDVEEMELPPSWDTIHALCAAWPPSARNPVDGQPREDAFLLASAVDSLANAHAVEGSTEDPASVLEQFPACVVPCILTAALAAFSARVRSLSPEEPAAATEAGEPAEDGYGQEDPGGSWMDAAAEDYFHDL